MASAGHADEAHLKALFAPALKAMAGWALLPNTYKYGAGQGLTEIYDGGYMQYVRAGVLEAATQTYRRGKDTVTVILHRMKSAASARRFFLYWRKSLGPLKPKTYPAKDAAFYFADAGALSGYLYRGPYLVSFSTSLKPDEKGRSALTSWMRALSAALAKPRGPAKAHGGSHGG